MAWELGAVGCNVRYQVIFVGELELCGYFLQVFFIFLAPVKNA
jgi:hypothetical protein